MVNLTIIIPHYNSVNTLKKLLDTIPTRSDIEIIVVDDKSTRDLENYELLKGDYSSKHIMFLNNNHDIKGAGVCRNIGLKHAKGKWVLFADSDDFFINDFYDIVSYYFDSVNDVIFFTPTSIEVDTGNKSNRHLQYEEKIYNFLKKRDEQTEISLRYEFSVPWSKMIKTRFLKEHKIEFDEVIASNDIMFSAKVGYHMKKFDVSEKVIYCVTKRKGSLTTNISDEVFDARLNVRIDYCNFLKSKLSLEQLKMLNLSGRSMIYNSIVYKLGFKKTIATYIKLRKNNIGIFDFRYLNPFFLVKKINYHYKFLKNNKRYLSKS